MQKILAQIARDVKALKAGMAKAPGPEDMWADGSLSVNGAVAFTGICRAELYKMMQLGICPYCTSGETHRLIPKRWIVGYLAELARVAGTDLHT